METTAFRHVRRLAGALVLAAFGLVWGGPPASAGVGVSPITLEFDDALRGGTFQQSLLLTNEPSGNAANPDEGAKLLTFKVAATGQAGSWVSFAPVGSTTPKTSYELGLRERAEVAVTVAVPADAANGTYTAAVEVEATQDVDVAGKSQAGVSSLAEVPITIVVGGTEKREAAVVDFAVDEAEVGMTQRFQAKVRNTGNVTVLSQLDLVVTRDGGQPITLSTKGGTFPVAPGQTDSVFFDWETAEQLGGVYTAKFSVTDTAGGSPKVIGTNDVAFRLEPRGTFTRSGQFADFVIREAPEVGGAGIVRGSFFNTGKIATNATLTAQVSRNGKLLKEVQSQPRNVRPGETGPIDLTIEAPEKGTYTVVGSFNFDGEVTEPKTVEFTVGTVSASSSTLRNLLLIGGAALVVAGIVARFVLVSGRRKRHASIRQTSRSAANNTTRRR
jgi:hypothetical protein